MAEFKITLQVGEANWTETYNVVADNRNEAIRIAMEYSTILLNRNRDLIIYGRHDYHGDNEL